MSMKNCPNTSQNPLTWTGQSIFLHSSQRPFFKKFIHQLHFCLKNAILFTVELCDTIFHINEVAILEKCYDLPPIVVCSSRSIPWILSFPLYSIFLQPIVCSHRDIAASCECYPVLYWQRTHIVPVITPCFVCKCAKYHHIINTAPSVRNITTVHKLTSPWESSNSMRGWVVSWVT